MEKTTNYQLPQWEANDPLRREDFNEAMAKIDTGIKAASYVIGNYIGNGLTMDEGGQLIALGFKPRFVIISRGWSSTTSVNAQFMAVGSIQVASLANAFKFGNNGFQVGIGSGGNTVNLNYDEVDYSYIAFR